VREPGRSGEIAEWLARAISRDALVGLFKYGLGDK